MPDYQVPAGVVRTVGGSDAFRKLLLLPPAERVTESFDGDRWAIDAALERADETLEVLGDAVLLPDGTAIARDRLIPDGLPVSWARVP